MARQRDAARQRRWQPGGWHGRSSDKRGRSRGPQADRRFLSAFCASPRRVSRMPTCWRLRRKSACAKRAASSGDYQLTEADVLQCASFDDSIGVNGWMVEEHVAGNMSFRWPGHSELPGLQPPALPHAAAKKGEQPAGGRALCASMTHGWASRPRACRALFCDGAGRRDGGSTGASSEGFDVTLAAAQAAWACRRTPSARATLSTVAKLGFPPSLSARYRLSRLSPASLAT
jgi:hypothetical protein